MSEQGSARTWPARDRQESNPIFSDRKLKFGSFQTNLDSACIMSDLEGRHHITWPNTVACAKPADEMEFEAIVPVARWRGFQKTTLPLLQQVGLR